MVISKAALRFAIGAAVCEILATSSAFAADPDPGGALEEVVVSAQFREEKLQSTPIAISAFTAENLESRGIVSVTDLDAFVPNAVIQPLGAGWGATMAAFIRGVGLGDNILSFEPGVPIYVDDVYIGRPQGAIFDLLDLERVEVLRGPQGTLFGKNAIGGTVRLISKKPTGDGTGSLSVAIGKFNRIDARGSTDVTLLDERVFARFSFSSKKADGYFNVLDYECVNGAGSLGSGGAGLADGTGVPSLGPGRLPDGSVPQNGYNNIGLFPNGGLQGIKLGSQVSNNGNCVVDTLGDENVQSGRAAFRFLLNDKMEFNLIGDLTNQRQKGPADKYTIMDPGGLNAFWNGVFAGPVFGNGVGWDPRFITPDLYSNYSRYDDPVTHRIVPNINNMNHWGVSGTFEWKLTDNVALKSVTAYRAFWNKFGRDSDGTPLPLNATYDDSRHRQFTQEIQLTGTVSQLNWATGAFYYDAHDSNKGFDFLYPTIIYENDAFDRQDTTNWAIFAQGTYQFTDAFSLTTGARYTHDQKDATIYRADFFGAVIINNAFVPTKATNTDVTVSADYQWNDNLMTYLKYATGFKGGGFSPRPASALQTEPFKPEKLKTIEVGTKSELLERKVRLNGALFYSKYIDQQTFAQQNDAAGINWFREVNAGKARIWGLEGELQAEPVRGLRIDGSFGYINYNLTDNEGNLLLFEGDNCGGQRCYSPRTPKYNGAVGLQYSFGSTMGSITPRIDAQYQSTIYFTTNNQGVQDGYTLVNGRLTWESDSHNWEVSAYGANLTDKGYFNGKLNLVGFFGREQGNPGVPRTWGLSFKRNFTAR